MSSLTSKALRGAAISYAEALTNAGRAADALPALREDAVELVKALDAKPALAVFLENPRISPEDKHKLVTATFEGRLHPLALNLLGLLVDRERALLLRAILEEFLEALERAEGIFPADVSTARELADDEKERVRAGLEKFTGCKLRVHWRVRPELLGGMLFRFKDVLVDGTLRHDLRKLRDRFLTGDRRVA